MTPYAISNMASDQNTVANPASQKRYMKTLIVVYITRFYNNKLIYKLNEWYPAPDIKVDQVILKCSILDDSC